MLYERTASYHVGLNIKLENPCHLKMVEFKDRFDAILQKKKNIYIYIYFALTQYNYHEFFRVSEFHIL